MKKGIRNIVFLILLLAIFSTLSANSKVELKETQTPNDDISMDLQKTLLEDKYSFKSEQYDLFDESFIENTILKNSVNVLSVGDIMAHTMQFDAAYRYEDNGYDFYEQFSDVAEKLSSKDFSIGNLETVFAGKDARYSGKNMIFNAPDNLGESIKKAGIDILTTANNHSLDRGYGGLSRTIEVLDNLEILHTGTYKTEEDSERILTFEKNGITFALLSYSYSTNGWQIPENHPYSINMMEEQKILYDIKKARELGVDIVMVAVHWGLEYHAFPNIHQTRLADSMFYAGADIVLGTHPHVLQPFEHKKIIDISGLEKNKFIIYSMGNFISGQRTSPRDIGMYINFKVSRKSSNPAYVEEVSVMPTWVQAKYLNGKMYMRILDIRDAIIRYNKELIDNISVEEYNRLLRVEKESVDHLFFNSQNKNYTLNENNEYIIYRIEDNDE